MNKTFIGQDPLAPNWFFQIYLDPQFSRSWHTHIATVTCGSAMERWSFQLHEIKVPEGMPDHMKKFAEQARALFSSEIPHADTLEKSEAFCKLVDGVVKKNKMVLVTNNGREYTHNAPFNFSFRHFGNLFVFQPDHEHANNFGLTFSGRLHLDTHQVGYNDDPYMALPSVLQLFTRTIRKKTVLHAQLAQLSPTQKPNHPPAFQNIFQMEYK
jgi:hypothetical protein